MHPVNRKACHKYWQPSRALWGVLLLGGFVFLAGCAETPPPSSATETEAETESPQPSQETQTAPQSQDSPDWELVRKLRVAESPSSDWRESAIYKEYYDIGYSWGKEEYMYPGPQPRYATIEQVLAWYEGYGHGVAAAFAWGPGPAQEAETTQPSPETVSAPQPQNSLSWEIVKDLSLAESPDSGWRESPIYKEYYDIGHLSGRGTPLYPGPQLRYARIEQVLAWYEGYHDGLGAGGSDGQQ